jgi:hypothetical protein
MRPKHNAKTGACLMQLVPAPQLPGLKRGAELLSGPASKALDPVVGFAVRRSLRHFLRKTAPSNRRRRVPFEAVLRWRLVELGQSYSVANGDVVLPSCW